MSQYQIYKNPNRSTAPIPKKFVPNYVRLGIDPQDAETTRYKEQLVDATKTPQENENEIEFFLPDAVEKNFDASETLSKDNDYLLYVDGKIYFKSSEKFLIEKTCENLIFGRSVEFKNQPVDIDRISILKKISINIKLTID